MLSEKLKKELNKQINFEMYSAYMYFELAAYFASRNLPGFTSMMKKQFQEEQDHALRIFDYIIERGDEVTFGDIKKFSFKFKSLLEVFEYILEHEQGITKRINGLVDEAIKAKDHATVTFLQYYVNIQVKEESGFKALIDKIKLVGEEGAVLLMLDKQASEF